MLEDIFITQPLAKVDKSFVKQALMLSLSAATAGGSYGLTKLGLNHFNKPDLAGNVPYPYLARKQTHLGVASALVAAPVTYMTLRAYFLRVEERRQLDALMENWKIVKEFLPENIAAGLNALAPFYQQKSVA